MTDADRDALADACRDAFFVANASTGNVLDANDRWAELCGEPADELIGRPVSAVVESKDSDADVSALERQLDEIRAGNSDEGRIDLSMVTDGGVEREVELHVATCGSDEGEPLVAGICREGPDHRRSASDPDGTRYRTMLEEFPNGLATCFDEDLRYTFAGGSLFEDLSLSPADLEGRTLSEVFPGENAERLEPLYRAALEGDSNVLELSFEGRDIRIFVRPVRNADGEVVGGMTFSQDVTELRQRERDLDAARKRYETLIEAAPDPIFVADASTGEIVEVNQDAEDLLGISRDRLVGRHQTELHPPDERYRALFERAVEEQLTVERFEDGSPVYVVTADGDRVPVAISTKTVDVDGRTVVYGIFRDNSDQIEHERLLTELQETTRTLLQAKTRARVSQGIVDAMNELLDLSGVAVYRFDDKDGVLRPQAYDADVESLVGEPPVFVPGESLAWDVFVEGERAVYDDVREAENVHNPDTAVRSELIVPLGDYGVLIAGETRTGGFERRTIELVDILAETARSAIEHVETTEDLRRRDNELDQQMQHLERLEEVNVQLRVISSILIQSDSRQDVEERICEHLVDVDPFAFAWIGEPDEINGVLVPRTWAGDGREYLDHISRSLVDVDEDDVKPSIETALTREQTVVRNAARGVSSDSWRNYLVTKGLLSSMSVPLMYDDVFYGVLTVYSREPSAFDGMAQSVLSELAEAIGYAINSIYRKHALSTDQVSELEFSVTDPACFFVRFAQRTGCSIEFEGMIPEDDGSAVVYVEIPEGSAENVLDYADRSTNIQEARVLEEGSGGSRIQFRLIDSFIGMTLADYGISLRSIEADSSGCSIGVTSPPTISPRKVQEVVRTVFPDAELIAKRERVQPDARSRGFEERYLSALTDRQRQVLTTAYRNGYFDSPKGASGKEIAEKMDVSPSAFHDNLRAAERKLLSSIVESSPGLDT